MVHGKQKQSKGIFNVLKVSQGAILFSHPTKIRPRVRQSPQPVEVELVQLFNVTELPKQLQQLTMFAIVCVLYDYLQVQVQLCLSNSLSTILNNSLALSSRPISAPTSIRSIMFDSLVISS